MSDEKKTWLSWARRIQAISQSGLAYCADPFDRERYEQLAGLAAEIVAEHTDKAVHEATLRDAFIEQIGYGTPKVGVRAAIIEDGKLLLVREVLDGRWAMPGGWADVGESAAQMVVREAREEAGVEIRASRLVGVWSTHQQHVEVDFYHHYKFIFLCERVGGQLATGLETSDVRFFGFDELPELSPGRNSLQHIEHARRAWLDPTLPVYFDAAE